MDTPPKLPEIKPEVNKEDSEEERKKSGFLGSLLSKLGGGAGATGGSGSGLLGGLLATKAGIIGLALVGSTVAGTVGLVGYKAFGPSAADHVGDARFQTLFAPRPAPEPGSEEAKAQAGGDGSSDSLNKLVQANSPSQADIDAKAKAEAEAKAKEEADAKAKADADAKAKADADVKAKADQNAKKKNNDSVLASKAGKLKAEAIGKLSPVARGGGGGGSSSASTSAANPVGARGSLGSFGASKGGAGGGLGKALGRKTGSLAQLKSVSRDQRGATSSYGAGATYDGGRAGTNISGDNATPTGGTGGNTGTGGSAGAPNAVGTDDRFPAPPPTDVSAANVTPWQGAINTAMMLIAGAALLLMGAAKVAKMPGYGTGVAYALCALAALLGIWAMAIGVQVAGGKYGQVFQGNMITMAGTLIVATAGIAAISVPSMATSGEPPALMYLSGGAALGALMMGYLTPTTSYPPDYFTDGKPCDLNYGMSQQDCSVNTATTTTSTVPTPTRLN